MATSSAPTTHFGIAGSTLGSVFVARSHKGVRAILFGDDRRACLRDLRQRFPAEELVEDKAALASILARVVRFVESPASGVRAVAQACGATPLALAIPCHRVVRGEGALSGYRWGISRKSTLLEREAAR
ncbi:MAG: methylated-DNA--[protein]-cysteine S-methyltransferase [Pseudomonadota bacterium]